MVAARHPGGHLCAGRCEIYSATHASNLAGMHVKQIKWLLFGFTVMFILSRVTIT